jgi:hypothetical protein
MTLGLRQRKSGLDPQEANRNKRLSAAGPPSTCKTLKSGAGNLQANGAAKRVKTGKELRDFDGAPSKNRLPHRASGDHAFQGTSNHKTNLTH